MEVIEQRENGRTELDVIETTPGTFRWVATVFRFATLNNTETETRGTTDHPTREEALTAGAACFKGNRSIA